MARWEIFGFRPNLRLRILFQADIILKMQENPKPFLRHLVFINLKIVEITMFDLFWKGRVPNTRVVNVVIFEKKIENMCLIRVGRKMGFKDFEKGSTSWNPNKSLKS